jgi:hypothetical protein
MRFDTLLRFGSGMIRTMGEFLWHLILVRPDLSTLPSHFLPSLYLSLATIRTWNLAHALEHPNRAGVRLDIESLHTIALEDEVSARSVIDRIESIPVYPRINDRSHSRSDHMPQADGQQDVHPQDGIHEPQYMPVMQTVDAYGNDMSWLLDFEADWMSGLNGRLGGF